MLEEARLGDTTLNAAFKLNRHTMLPGIPNMIGIDRQSIHVRRQ